MEWHRFNYDIMRVGRVTRMKDRSLASRDLQHLAFIASFVKSLKEVSFQPNSEDEMTPSVYKERARAAFDHADVDFLGSLTEQQYKIAMTAVFGYRPDKVEVKQVYQSTDRVSYEEFEKWVFKKCATNNSQINAEIIFALLDKDYKGYLILDDFYSASKAVDLKVPSLVWQTVFKDLDRYKKGYIDFDELSRVLPAV